MNCINCNKPLRSDNTHGYCREHRTSYTSKYNKKYREKNREKLIAHSAKYYNDNREQLQNQSRIASREYYQNNKEKKLTYQRNKRKISIEYKLKVNLRSRLYLAIKNNYKAGSAVKDLGCTIQEFKIYIESKFQPGMTWDNWGINTWHLDHIVPLSSFDLTIREELIKAVNFTNLQPLWAIDNLKKSDKVI